MKLQELADFRLSDAVKFHSKLNPVLFDGDHMDPQVRHQLLEIAQDFMEHLGIGDLDVKDIRISGSNAAYTYTPHSDIDLHIIVDIASLGNDEVYRELFTAKKTVYNDTHDITIRGYDVELYVEDSSQPVKSLGEYSVLKDKWIKHPVKRRSNFDEMTSRSKFAKLVQLAQLAIESNDLDRVQRLIDTIRKYRQAGLDTHGEFGPENLAYKALRSRGIVDKLYKHRDKLHGSQLSLDEHSEFSNLKQLKKAIHQLPKWEDYLSDRNSWWSYRNKISDILSEMGKIKLLRPILKESIDRINRSRVLGENHDFPENNTRCLSSLISFINTEQVLPSDLKNGQTLDLVRINTINYSKVIILEIHRGVTVDKIIDDNTVIVQGDNNLHRIVVDEILIDNLDTGYYCFFLDADKLISGLFFYKDQIEKNEWSVELDDTKLSEDYHPNDTPPGPEFKPTMPAGTVKVDVSDVYDWYKLGQHISNLEGLGKHDFGAGPPSTIMAFGSEDAEHKYIDALKKTGLTTTDIDPFDPKQPKSIKRQKTDPTYNVNESFDSPYSMTWEKSDYGDIDAIANLPDGSTLSIMFNKQQDDEGNEIIQVEFYRNNSQEVTGEGDAMRIFATVLTAIQQYVKKYKPSRLSFSASKQVEHGQNAESRAKLYDRLVQRYARTWGYRAFRADNGDLVIYELSRIKPKVAESQTAKAGIVQTDVYGSKAYHAKCLEPDCDWESRRYDKIKQAQAAAQKHSEQHFVKKKDVTERDDSKTISFKLSKGKGKFATMMIVDKVPVGIYQYDSNTGRSIAEIYPEYKGRGLGKILVLHAIYTAAKLGLDFVEDESRTAEYDNVLDSLSSNGYIVDDEGYWYVTGDGEQWLKQSLKQGVIEASGYIPSEKEKNDPRFKTALTVDVGPNSIKKNAKAFGFKVSRAGIPPTLKP